MITELLMKPGRFDVKLKPSTPYSICSAVAPFDHLVVTPSRLQPLSGFDDANILAASIYTGVVTHPPRSNLQIGGEGPAVWMGTTDGRGDLLDSAVTNTAGNLATWVSSLRPSALAAGTVTSPGGTLTYTFQFVTRREALDWVCRVLGAEWRVMPDLTLDAAAPSTLFVSSPTAVITRKPEGVEPGMNGIEAVDLFQDEDVDGYTTKVIVVAKTGDGAAVATGSATGSNVYKDGWNNDVVLERLVNAPDTSAANANTVATQALALYSSTRKTITLTSRTYAVPIRVVPGDWVYVYDPAGGLVDTANQLTWRGELVAPLLLRCKGYTWPLQAGMGVYARRAGATPTYTDLSDYVVWDTGDTRWEVGTSFTDPDQDPGQLSPAYLGVNPDILNRVAGAVGVLAVTDNQTSTSALAAGISTTEASTNLTTPAVATLAGRRYRITFTCELRAGQNLTSYGTARVRRGTTTAGTIVYGPVGISKRAGTASRDVVTIVAYDAPGAQSSQRWVLTLATDASAVDVYSPSSAVVECVGPA